MRMPQAGLDRHRCSSAAALASCRVSWGENLPGWGKIQPWQASECSVGCPALPFRFFRGNSVLEFRGNRAEIAFIPEISWCVGGRGQGCSWGSPCKLFGVPPHSPSLSPSGRRWEEFYKKRGLEAIKGSDWEWLNISKQLGWKLVGWEWCRQVLCSSAHNSGIILFPSSVYMCFSLLNA